MEPGVASSCNIESLSPVKASWAKLRLRGTLEIKLFGELGGVLCPCVLPFQVALEAPCGTSG